MESKKIGVGIDIILEKDNKILLGYLAESWRSKEHKWGLPGNEIMPGESLKTAVERNINNIGLKLKSFSVFSINENFWLGNHYITIGIKANAEGEPTADKKDFEKFEWFEKNNLPEKLAPPASQTLSCFLNKKISV